MNIDDQFLSENTLDEAIKVFENAIQTGASFKLQSNVRNADIDELDFDTLIDSLPEKGMTIANVQKEFNERFLPYCYNFASPNFMGFPDAGNSIAAIAGSITSDFLQQNLINQSFCSPSATFAEISVIRWLREVVGYTNPETVSDVFDVGGVITGGGTTSNTIGILLARENHMPNTMTNGVTSLDDYYLVVPKGIGHYSVKSAQMWIGCGQRLLEVETKDFRYDIKELEKTIKKYNGKIMCVVAYAGDSRTMTVEHFEEVAKVVKSVNPNIWLHADACHGFSLGFSDNLRHKLKGIEQFDSITTDPHKVLNSPYTISALLVKDPQKMRTVSSTSDLIMQEQFAFGQITPFLGSRPWSSIKLWFAIKNLGREGLGKVIDNRHKLAQDLVTIVDNSKDFVSLNKVDINSVAFMYMGTDDTVTIEEMNALNKKIHTIIIRDGLYHLHQFSVPDSGIFKKGTMLYPLRFMSGNPLTKEPDLNEMLKYIRRIAKQAQGDTI